MKEVNLSIITPCFNESLSISECVSKVQNVMKSELPDVNYEHIFIDNDSTDDTVDQLRLLAESDSRIRIVVNSRNIGTTRSIYRALSKTSGNAIIPMLPADLQDPAEMIPEFYKQWTFGYLVVYGQRMNRKEKLAMRLARNIYYRIIRKFSTAKPLLHAGDFMLIDKTVNESITVLKDENPYIRGLVAQTGIKAIVIKYDWGQRKFGKSSANPLVLIDIAINGLISTSKLPARIGLISGFLVSFVSMLVGIYVYCSWAFFDFEIAPGLTTIAIAVFFLSGIQLSFMGLIGEYVLSIHGQVRPEPKVFDKLLINFGDEND
jgi:glycosyltransferase involved in cell wall biosynthesis